jgi:hypothetical protein
MLFTYLMGSRIYELMMPALCGDFIIIREEDESVG